MVENDQGDTIYVYRLNVDQNTHSPYLSPKVPLSTPSPPTQPGKICRNVMNIIFFNADPITLVCK